LLHLDSSASPIDLSVSRQLTALYAQRWSGRRTYRDLARDPVRLIGPGYVTLGTRREREGVLAPADSDEAREWALTKPLIDELCAANVVLLGVPMYNFGVSAPLKAWIDRISFPGAYDDGGLHDTTVIAVLARGGAYGPGTPREGCDFQEPYLRAHFGKLGVTDLRFVRAELTRADDIPELGQFRDMAAKSLALAREQLLAMV